MAAHHLLLLLAVTSFAAFAGVEAPADGLADGLVLKTRVPTTVEDGGEGAIRWKRLNLTAPAPAGAPAPAPAAAAEKKPLSQRVVNYIGSGIGMAYYTAPMAAYHWTDNWEAAFFDAFTPTSIWLDVASSLVIEVYHLFAHEDYKEVLDLILPDVFGPMISLIGLYTYLTKKEDVDPNLTPRKKSIHLAALLLWFLVPWMIFVFQMDMEKLHFKDSKYAFIAVLVVACLEVAQMGAPILFRLMEWNAADDEPAVRNTKIGSAICQVVSSGADAYIFFVSGYSHKMEGGLEWSALMIAVVQCGFGIVLVIARLIGPSKFLVAVFSFKAFIMFCGQKVWAGVKFLWQKVSAALEP